MRKYKYIYIYISKKYSKEIEEIIGERKNAGMPKKYQNWLRKFKNAKG
jgi:hypothetical protein